MSRSIAARPTARSPARSPASSSVLADIPYAAPPVGEARCEAPSLMPTEADFPRMASLVVLKAPDMPSILLENSYISNPSDAAFLDSREGPGKPRKATAARWTCSSPGAWRSGSQCGDRRQCGRTHRIDISAPSVCCTLDGFYLRSQSGCATGLVERRVSGDLDNTTEGRIPVGSEADRDNGATFCVLAHRRCRVVNG